MARPGGPPYSLEFYTDEDGREVVKDWMRELSPQQRMALGVALHELLRELGPNVCETKHGKQLKDGLFEFRHCYGDKIVLLLGGYDKGADTKGRRQQVEIERARARLTAWKARLKGEATAARRPPGGPRRR